MVQPSGESGLTGNPVYGPSSLWMEWYGIKWYGIVWCGMVHPPDEESSSSISLDPSSVQSCPSNLYIVLAVHFHFRFISPEINYLF